MTENEKKQVRALWESGMTLAQIRQMTPIEPRAFDLAVREMKRNGEFPQLRNTCADKIIEAYHRGERNPYAIADTYGVKVNYVYWVLARNKLRLGKKTRVFVHSERTTAIVEDLKDGALSQVEIAKKHGVSRQYITKIKKKLERGILDDEPNRSF